MMCHQNVLYLVRFIFLVDQWTFWKLKDPFASLSLLQTFEVALQVYKTMSSFSYNSAETVSTTTPNNFEKICLLVLLKGTVLPNFVFIYYWSDCNENSWTHGNSECIWAYCRVLFPIFFIENKLFTENG